MDFATMTERQQIKYLLKMSAEEERSSSSRGPVFSTETENAAPVDAPSKKQITESRSGKAPPPPPPPSPDAAASGASGHREGALKDKNQCPAEEEARALVMMPSSGGDERRVEEEAVTDTEEALVVPSPGGDDRREVEAALPVAVSSSSSSTVDEEQEACFCAADSAHPPACWFARNEVPEVGSVLAVHAYPGSDTISPARWYSARVVKVLSRGDGKRGRPKRGRLKITYDCDGSDDVLEWPDFEQVLLVGRPVEDLLCSGKCLASGLVTVVVPPDLLEEEKEHKGELAVTFELRSVREEEEDVTRDRLHDYKEIADLLLPAMRGRSCLFNSIFSSTSTTILAMVGGSVVGGCSFRILRCGDSIVVDVLTICISQLAAGRGIATKLVDLVKRCALRISSKGATFIAVAAESTPQAMAFWLKQRLKPGPHAEHLMDHLLHSKLAMRYDNVTHMAMRLRKHEEGASSSSSSSPGEGLPKPTMVPALLPISDDEPTVDGLTTGLGALRVLDSD